MREVADADRIRELLRRLGAQARTPTRLYLTGGATAVLLGWRTSTVDVDVKLVPDSDAVRRAIPELKEELSLNVKLAAPSDFIPELAGWQDRSLFVSREGKLAVFHFDLYSQALSKIERDHEIDRADVREMLARGLVEPTKLRELFTSIRPSLYRQPAIDPTSFERCLDETLARPDAGE